MLAPLIGLMPQAALAAVVVAYSVDLIQPVEFAVIRRVRRKEFRWAAIAFVGVVLLGTLQGILVAVIASLLALAQQSYDPPVNVVGRKRGTDVFRPRSSEHPDDEAWPGLLILRVEGRAFFLNAQRIGDKLTQLIAAAQPVRRHPRWPRADRHRIHGAEDAHRRRKRSCAARASRCGWRR